MRHRIFFLRFIHRLLGKIRMPKSPPSFPFFHQDFRDGVRRLTREQIGAYVLLLIEQFEIGFVPQNARELAQVCSTQINHCEPEDFRKLWQNLQEKFVETEDGFINEKMDDIRKKAFSTWEKNKKNAQKGVKARRSKRSTASKISQPTTRSTDRLSGGTTAPEEGKGNRKREDNTLKKNGISKTLKDLHFDEIEKLPDAQKSKVREWLDYKRERSQPYKPVGLKAFLRKFLNLVESVGESEACDRVDQAIANQYQGVVWKTNGSSKQLEVKSNNRFCK